MLNKSEERSEKRVVFVHTAVFESEKLMCEKIFSKRVNFFVHVRHFQAVFFQFFFWLRGLVMIFFYFKAGVGSGLKVSGNLYEFYANSDVFHVFC